MLLAVRLVAVLLHHSEAPVAALASGRTRWMLVQSWASLAVCSPMVVVVGEEGVGVGHHQVEGEGVGHHQVEVEGVGHHWEEGEGVGHHRVEVVEVEVEVVVVSYQL